jgi:hypothetical protein
MDPALGKEAGTGQMAKDDKTPPGRLAPSIKDGEGIHGGEGVLAEHRWSRYFDGGKGGRIGDELLGEGRVKAERQKDWQKTGIRVGGGEGG